MSRGPDSSSAASLALRSLGGVVQGSPRRRVAFGSEGGGVGNTFTSVSAIVELRPNTSVVALWKSREACQSWLVRDNPQPAVSRCENETLPL